MLLLFELFLAVGEGALVTELALLAANPEFADLGLLLEFVSGLVKI